MIRSLIVATLLAFAATTFTPMVVSSDKAQAQSAGDRKVQPGNSQCRDSVGRKC
jgi:hypothetical protein